MLFTVTATSLRIGGFMGTIGALRDCIRNASMSVNESDIGVTP
jgi:hypothetical protein